MSTNEHLEWAKRKHAQNSLKSYYRKMLRERGVLFNEHDSMEVLKQLYREVNPHADPKTPDPPPTAKLDTFIPTPKPQPAQQDPPKTYPVEEGISPLIHGRPPRMGQPVSLTLNQWLVKHSQDLEELREEEEEKRKKNPWLDFSLVGD